MLVFFVRGEFSFLSGVVEGSLKLDFFGLFEGLNLVVVVDVGIGLV